MSQPPAYDPSTDFSEEERTNVGGRSTVSTAGLDAELSAIATSINATRDNIALNQRDDGEIRDGRVKLFTLSSDVLALIVSQGDVTPRGAWLTATVYNLKDLVTQGGNTYICSVGHTSGVFATDLAAVKWLLLALSSFPSAASVPFSPAGTIAATNVQAAVEEVDADAKTREAALDALIRADLLDTSAAAKNAGMVGFLYSLAYGAGTLGKWLKDLALGAGSTFIGWIASGAGAVVRTVQAKLRDYPSVIDYGADPTGANNSYQAIMDAKAANGHTWLPFGTYRIDQAIDLSDEQTLEWAGGAKLKAGVNNMTMIRSTVSAYASKLIRPRLIGTGKTNITGLDMTNFRVSAVLDDMLVQDMEVGAIFRTGCFGLEVKSPSSTNVHYPIRVMANCSNMLIENPSVDNELAVGGDGTGIGIDIQSGGSSNLGVRVIGGYSQGFTIGVQDAGIGTKVHDTYLEGCVTADIYSTASRASVYRGTQHFGPSGAACFKLRNCDAVFTGDYIMASGARTVVHDVDNTNTNCVYDETGSNAFYNVPVNTAADATSKSFMKRVALQTFGTWTPDVLGTTSEGAGTYSSRSGKWTKVGDLVNFNATMVLAAHSGTGNILINGLPIGLLPASFTPVPIFSLAINGIPYTGPAIYAYFNGTSSAPNGIQISLAQVSTAGVTSLIPLPAGATTLHLAGSYRMTA